jgi:hypothetical protein
MKNIFYSDSRLQKYFSYFSSRFRLASWFGKSCVTTLKHFFTEVPKNAEYDVDSESVEKLQERVGIMWFFIF